MTTQQQTVSPFRSMLKANFDAIGASMANITAESARIAEVANKLAEAKAVAKYAEIELEFAKRREARLAK